MPTSRFIEQGYLVPFSHYVQANPDLSKLKTSKGDYVTKMLSNVMMDNKVMMDLLDSYKEKCNGMTAIVFAVDVEHSKDIASKFNSAGIIPRHLDAKTPTGERVQILSDFRSGRVKVISNVEIITEGFDFPECQVVQLAGPTKSLSLYLQMIGRVMRTAEGKKEGIVLDNAGLWLEHGLSDADRIWSLKGINKKRRNGLREINELAIDKEGVIKAVTRFRPEEVKGLKLIPMSEEFRRLVMFEDLLKIAIENERKLLYPYFQYIKYLIRHGHAKLTNIELEYIKKRLNYFNHESRSMSEKRYKPGFWVNQQKFLSALPTIEYLDGVYLGER
jgi:superfamily II DNA or RNA helicase